MLGDNMKYIGVIGRNNDKITYNKEIIDVIYNYNCIPICISLRFLDDYEKEFTLIKPLLDMCDGFILQGGSEFYNIDILIVKYLHNNDIPTLGICLGMQTMACAFNGILNNIDEHNSNEKYVHNIIINKKSKLYKIINKDEISVNSRHNEYVYNTDLEKSSYSNILESIEDSNKKFFIGVQWHPESLMDKNSILLFNSFFFSIN